MCLPNQAAGAGVQPSCLHAHTCSAAVLEASALPNKKQSPQTTGCANIATAPASPSSPFSSRSPNTVGLATGRVETQQHRFTYNEPMPLESVTQASSWALSD